MKKLLLIFLLASFYGYSQIPRTVSTLTVTNEIRLEKTKSSHGFSVGNWLTIDGSGVYVKGSDPSTEAFIGIVPTVPTANTFTFVQPGGTINTLSGLTAGQTYYAQSDGTVALTSSPKPVMIATSTTSAILLSGSFGVTLPQPETQASNLTITDITATTATASVTRGSGDYVMFLLSEDPISVFPQDNQTYAADANFGDGDELAGSGVFVLQAGEENSVAITGLNAATLYYALALEYDAQGLIVAYNTTVVTNGDPFSTLPSATTPTTQWTTTSKKSKETSVEVTGMRGNGDRIIVLASHLGEPDTNPVDGVSYTADALNNGSQLGNSWVVFKGTATTFSIDGLTRDRKVYFKIMEMEDTGLLYNTNATVDSAFVAFIYEGGSGAFVESTDPPGLTLLENEAYYYLDASQLTFSDETNISNGDAGLVDQSGNGNAATIVGTPVTNDITINSATRKSSRTSSSSALSTNNNATTWFSNSSGFGLHWSGEITDGQTASGTTDLMGVYSTGDNRVLLRFREAGNIQLIIRTPSGGATSTIWQSTSAVLADGVNSGAVVQIQVDWINDIINCWFNDASVPGSVSSGPAISAHDPTGFTSSHSFYIGNNNSAGTAAGNTSSVPSTSRAAVTPVLTSTEREDVYEVMAFTATTGNSFVRIDVTDPAGYTSSNEDDSLRVTGSAGGFLNYLEFIDVLPDSLQDFKVTASFKIKSALTTNASGLGTGIRNLTASEANHAQFGHLSMDTNASSFGKAELFSGTGATGDNSVTFRSPSSGVFIPANDSSYQVIYERSVIGNDALNSITIYDPTDSSTLTTDWVEVNRPSSAYFGTTMKAFIWFQGPDFKIGEFSVVRTREDNTTAPPAPFTPDFRVTVDGTGDDGNPCTNAAPCATLPVGIAALAASGGSDKSFALSAGTHLLGTSLVLPANLGDFVGAGIDVTFIGGTSTMNQPFGYANNSRALIQAVSSSSTNVTTTFSGFTLRGGSPSARLKNNGLYIRFRNNIVVDGIKIEYFNTAGIYIDRANNVQVTNSTFIESGGSNNQNSSTGYPPIGNIGSFSTGNIMLIGPISSGEIDNNTITATTYGSGYGLKTGGTSGSNSFDNILFHNNPVTINGTSAGSTGPNFSLEFHDALLSSGDVFGDLDVYSNIFTGGQISLSTETVAANDGQHKVYNNVFNTATAVMEAFAHNIEFYGNWAYGGCRGILFQGGTAQSTTYSNHNVHHNYAEITSGVGIFKYTRRILNGYYGNNTFVAISTSGNPFLVCTGTTAGATFTIEDNALYGNFGTGAFLSFSQNPTGSISRNNFATNVNTTQTLTGVTVTANQTGLNGSGWFRFSGAKPTPYYELPGASSALWNAGNGSDDIGSYQHE